MKMKRIIGRDYVCEVLTLALSEQNRSAGEPSAVDGTMNFCSNPEEYEWKYLDKKEMLVPYICDAASLCMKPEVTQLKLAKSGKIRWEKHRVWIVEGTLRRGESNILSRRRFYLDETSWLILLGEGYDRAGMVTKCFMFQRESMSSISKQGQWYSINNPEDRSEQSI